MAAESPRAEVSLLVFRAKAIAFKVLVVRTINPLAFSYQPPSLFQPCAVSTTDCGCVLFVCRLRRRRWRWRWRFGSSGIQRSPKWRLECHGQNSDWQAPRTGSPPFLLRVCWSFAFRCGGIALRWGCGWRMGGGEGAGSAAAGFPRNQTEPTIRIQGQPNII